MGVDIMVFFVTALFLLISLGDPVCSPIENRKGLLMPLLEKQRPKKANDKIEKQNVNGYSNFVKGL
jgi:hypothetical protein